MFADDPNEAINSDLLHYFWDILKLSSDADGIVDKQQLMERLVYGFRVKMKAKSNFFYSEGTRLIYITYERLPSSTVYDVSSSQCYSVYEKDTSPIRLIQVVLWTVPNMK